MFGTTTNLASEQKHHTPRTIVPALEAAEEELEKEIEAMEREAQELLEGIKSRVGGLSDLVWTVWECGGGAGGCWGAEGLGKVGEEMRWVREMEEGRDGWTEALGIPTMDLLNYISLLSCQCKRYLEPIQTHVSSRAPREHGSKHAKRSILD